MQVAQDVGQPESDPLELFRLEALASSDAGCQRLPLDVLLHEIKRAPTLVVLSLEDLVEIRNALVLEASQDIRFSLEEFERLPLIQFVESHDLDRDIATLARVMTEIRRGEPATPQRRLHLVTILKGNTIPQRVCHDLLLHYGELRRSDPYFSTIR